MTRKVIQVPMEADLLQALDSRSKQDGRSRAELIREACRHYLRRLEVEQLEQVYQDGYLRVPEGRELGEVQASLTAQVLPKETW